MRYFFDVFIDGSLVADNEGKDFPTDEAVQLEALQRALKLKRKLSSAL